MNIICFDLDDTLFPELEYLKSAYWEIVLFALKRRGEINSSFNITANEGYETMLNAFYNGKNAFEQLNKAFGLDIPLKTYLDIYRNHKPKRQHNEKLTFLLSSLSQEDNILGIISDGRSVQQRNKIAALDIEHFFAKENIIISEEFGSQKPAEKNYSNFMERYPDTERFIYVGDNTEKDFIAPNKLGWLTVGLLDKGGNIHKQRTDLPIDFLPKVWIKELREISSLIFPEADTKVL